MAPGMREGLPEVRRYSSKNVFTTSTRLRIHFPLFRLAETASSPALADLECHHRVSAHGQSVLSGASAQRQFSVTSELWQFAAFALPSWRALKFAQCFRYGGDALDNPERDSARELSIRVLGPLEVTSATGRHLAIAGRKSHALLGYISAQPQCRESRDKLATLLWGDRFQEQARHSLRQAIL